MSILALPALIALLFKAGLFAYALRAPRHNSKTRLFMALLILFSLHNAVEFIGFNHFAAYGFDEFIELCGYLYFVIGIPFFVVLLHLSLALSIDNWQSRARYVWILYVPALILEYLLLGTDKLVTGFRYSIITRSCACRDRCISCLKPMRHYTYWPQWFISCTVRGRRVCRSSTEFAIVIGSSAYCHLYC